MSYQTHRAFSALPTGGDFADEHQVFDIAPGGTPKLGVQCRYEADPAATGAFPGFRVRWFLAGGPTNGTLAILRVSSVTLPEDEPFAIMRERLGIVHCEDLIDADEN